MINELLDNILYKTQVRQSLSMLRQEIKEPSVLAQVRALTGTAQWQEVLISLLEEEDAKIRKNCALLMGDLQDTAFLPALFSHYQTEQQLFVRSAYLQGMQSYDCSGYAKQLREQLDSLSKITITPENSKHIAQESKELSDILIRAEGKQIHEFRGNHELSEIILITNRKHMQLTAAQITSDNVDILSAGIHLITNRLDEIIPIRTYQEILFVVPGMKICETDVGAAARKIADSELLTFLGKRHKGKAPFYFRLEMKGKMDLDKKSVFLKRLATQIERETKRQLINSVSDYEFEIRLIANKGGNFNILVKLMTLPDERFIYRKESVAASIKPVNAAILVEMAKEYMIPDAQVLDPFCGVGTMLIERQKVVPANTSYGIDTLAEAIDKARRNTEAAGQIIHYINTNFFVFTHEYLFDEIFTNMPFAIGRTTQEEIEELYERFFEKARKHLNKFGRIILYTHDKQLVEAKAHSHGFKILFNQEVMDREGTHLYVLEKILLK